MTGDISLAAQQFFHVTKNTTWLQREGFALIEGIARFWASKAVLNSDGSYSIAQTQSPDEYHTNVTDSVFTNSVAKQSLLGAYELASAAGVKPNATFKNVADRLRILYSKERDFHPAYINGRSGEVYNATCVPQRGGGLSGGQCEVLADGGKIKQADVVLIYFPLMVDGVAPSTQRRDLDLYSRLTDINGCVGPCPCPCPCRLTTSHAARVSRAIRSPAADCADALLALPPSLPPS